MVDLTVEVAWTCATNEYCEICVHGSQGDLYTVHFGRLPEAQVAARGVQHDWQCECRGYRFRGTCRHIAQARQSGVRCGWNEALDPGAKPAKDAQGNLCCPQCGGRVKAYRVAV